MDQTNLLEILETTLSDMSRAACREKGEAKMAFSFAAIAMILATFTFVLGPLPGALIFIVLAVACCLLAVELCAAYRTLSIEIASLQQKLADSEIKVECSGIAPTASLIERAPKQL